MSATPSDDYVSGARETLIWLRNVIDNQIEARTTKPARIEEPGWAEQVCASDAAQGRHIWLRMSISRTDQGAIWTDGSRDLRWDHLIDPVLVRKGVQS